VAIKANHPEELASYERRQYDEVQSAIVEALKGTLATHYTFNLKDGKLVARDGEDIEQLLERGVELADEMVAKNPFFEQFLPRRAATELAEHRENLAMAAGKTDFNTNVVLSPYNEELHTKETEDLLVEAGQKPYSKRAMLRISHWDGEMLHIITRSLDESSLKLLQAAVIRATGYSYDAATPNEMLAERIHKNMTIDEVLVLADRITGAFDKILAERKGGRWQQGRSEDDAANIQRHVELSDDIVRELISEGRCLALEQPDYLSYKKAFEAKLYDYAALIEKRLETGVSEKVDDIQTAASAAGAVAASEGRVYDMCGMVISASSKQAGTAAQTGLESLARLEGKKITCPECKSKVVVPREDLKAGKLTCSDCGYGVDVCTGRTYKKSRARKEKPKELDIFDILSLELQRYTEQIQLAEYLAKQKEELKKQKDAGTQNSNKEHNMKILN